MRAGIPTGLALNTPISLARKQELQQLAWKDGTGRTAGIQVQHQYLLCRKVRSVLFPESHVTIVLKNYIYFEKLGLHD